MNTDHERYFNEAAKVACDAMCKRDKCGAVIVKDAVVIGKGFNSPAGGNASDCKCDLDLKQSLKIKSDRTCCMHAEWRAIIDALRRGHDLSESTLYFTRVDEHGSMLRSGEPYCTVCSRLALDVGISFFALWHDSGITLYDTHDYNERSYRFHEKYTSKNH